MSRRKLNVLLALAMTILAGVQPQAWADERHDREGNWLTGTWIVQVMPYNCMNGDSNPAAAFESLFSFHSDGTFTAWLQNSTIFSTRSPSFGTWMRERRSGALTIKFIHLRYDLQTGKFLGRQQAVASLQRGEGGDDFTATSRSTVLDVNGSAAPQSCATMAGARF